MRTPYERKPKPLPAPTQEAWDRNIHHCDDPQCGQPQQGAGRPRSGWVKLGNAHDGYRWFCSYYCASRGSIVFALRGETPVPGPITKV